MYAIIKIDFVGNDDFNFQGFKIGLTKSIQATVDLIRDNLEKAFDDAEGILEVYHSDNDQTPFEDVEELLDAIVVEEITEAEYKTLKKFVGQSYGCTIRYMEFA